LLLDTEGAEEDVAVEVVFHRLCHGEIIGGGGREVVRVDGAGIKEAGAECVSKQVAQLQGK